MSTWGVTLTRKIAPSPSSNAEGAGEVSRIGDPARLFVEWMIPEMRKIGSTSGWFAVQDGNEIFFCPRDGEWGGVDIEKHITRHGAVADGPKGDADEEGDEYPK